MVVMVLRMKLPSEARASLVSLLLRLCPLSKVL